MIIAEGECKGYWIDKALAQDRAGDCVLGLGNRLGDFSATYSGQPEMRLRGGFERALSIASGTIGLLSTLSPFC
jgi:hypothetical protein